MKVCTSKGAWRRFLGRARAAMPLEHIEALYGHETIDTFRIVKFKRIELTVQTKDTLDYTRKEIERHKKAAKDTGMEFLGTIHTHPGDADPGGSEDDHISAFRANEKIMGIVHLYKKKGKWVYIPRWWFPQMPVAFELLDE